MWFYRYTSFFCYYSIFDLVLATPIVFKILDSGHACMAVFNLLIYVEFMKILIIITYLLEKNRVFEIVTNRDFESVCF